jgi:hypothetical protein
MINDSLIKHSSRSFFSRFSRGVTQLVDLLAETSHLMRCAREAERLSQLSNAELGHLGVKRNEIVQYAFRGFLSEIPGASKTL